MPKEGNTELTMQIDDKIIGATLASYGSVEGELLAITLLNKPIFKIRSLLDNETVECNFSLEDLEKARAALNKKVCVYGLILSKENGRKIRISVDDIEIFPLEKDLPSIGDFADLWSSPA